MGFPGGIVVKNLPTNAGDACLGLEGPLEKEMATHSSILVWKIPWTEEPGGLQSVWCQSNTTEHTTQGFTDIIVFIHHSQPHEEGTVTILPKLPLRNQAQRDLSLLSYVTSQQKQQDLKPDCLNSKTVPLTTTLYSTFRQK